MGNIIEIIDDSFKDLVLKQDTTDVVCFTADWCKSCQNVKPQLEHLAKEYEGTVLVGTIDVDLNPETVSEYGIRNIPAILYFRNGELLDKHIGAGTFIELRDKLEKLL